METQLNKILLAVEKMNSYLIQNIDLMDKRIENNHIGWWAVKEEIEALKDYLGIEYREESKKITRKFRKIRKNEK